ncbi:MAG: CapA family protein [Planctomycetota bacterium]|nr:CapA family protein [Planctomycetota bacterium]
MEPIAQLKLAPEAGPVLRLLAAGDVGFYLSDEADAETVVGSLEDVYSPDLLQVLRDKDISFANLETPLARSVAPPAKDGPNLWAPPAAIRVLTDGGFDLAMLANNHIMDQGVEGLTGTLAACRAVGIRPLGAGANLAEARQPAVLQVQGVRVGFLALADADVLSAGETTPGGALLDLTAVVPAMEKLKQQADVIIVSVHAGKQHSPVPSPRVQRLYRCLVDCGAAAIIGHHPHTIQGIEVYRGAPIIYSLGDFYFPSVWPTPPCSSQGMVARLILAAGRVATVEVYACEQSAGGLARRVRLMTGENKEAQRRRLDRFSQLAADPEQVRKFYQCVCFENRGSYFDYLKASAASVHGSFLGMVKAALSRRDVSYLPGIAADYVHYLLMGKAARTRQIVRLRGLWVTPELRELLSTLLEMEQAGKMPDPAAWAEFQSWKPSFTGERCPNQPRRTGAAKSSPVTCASGAGRARACARRPICVCV